MTENCNREALQQLKGSDRSDSKKVSQAKSSVNKSPTSRDGKTFKKNCVVRGPRRVKFIVLKSEHKSWGWPEDISQGKIVIKDDVINFSV